MENIKIENTWNSCGNYPEDCCCFSRCSPYKTTCDFHNSHHRPFNLIDLPNYMSCGSLLFMNNLYAKGYPNLIITIEYGGILNIFDTTQNKVIFSSKNIFDIETLGLIERSRSATDRTAHADLKDARINRNNVMMMENFMVVRFNIIGQGDKGECYIVFNFKTHAYKLFMYCILYINYDRTLFVFHGKDKNKCCKIITKSDIDNSIDNIMEIKFDLLTETCICCMCNSSTIVFINTKIVGDMKYIYHYIYYDIRKQKNVYTSVNKFIGWRGHKFIEYNEELKKCNLVSIISDDIQQFLVKNNIPKKIINCDRCLDKFEESAEEVNQDHKNICSLCKKN